MPEASDPLCGVATYPDAALGKLQRERFAKGSHNVAAVGVTHEETVTSFGHMQRDQQAKTCVNAILIAFAWCVVGTRRSEPAR